MEKLLPIQIVNNLQAKQNHQLEVEISKQVDKPVFELFFLIVELECFHLVVLNLEFYVFALIEEFVFLVLLLLKFGKVLNLDDLFLFHQKILETYDDVQKIDFFNFLASDTELASQIKSNYTLLCIPMLNPDGAFAYTRENANSVDLNRDAFLCSQPEMKLLRAIYKNFKFCFTNYHRSCINSFQCYTRNKSNIMPASFNLALNRW